MKDVIEWRGWRRDRVVWRRWVGIWFLALLLLPKDIDSVL
jgi:hypothetical protein